jgi:beta-glucanase (GH16 family)
LEWETVFEDEFDENLNQEIWTPVVFTGLMSINENFVTKGEKQMFTDGKNLEVSNSMLSIQTKRESAKGKAWSPKSGFMEQDFEYTSGTLNTAKAFRFNQGKIEAKINIQQANSIIHGLSLKGETITPHIDLIKTGKGNGYEVRYIAKNNPNSIVSHKVKGININDKDYIHGLEWTEKELIWSLNGLEIARENHQLNGEELYINMASIVEKAPESLPAEFKIDWIKVYKKQKAE